jgi:hypothetical protein
MVGFLWSPRSFGLLLRGADDFLNMQLLCL